MPANGKKVLVAVPCYNEELAIAGIVLRAKKHADQVLVVDDGSRDRTSDNAYLAGAVVLQHPHNQGKGAAIRTAFRYAAKNGFDALVLLDGDGQHDADEIPIVAAPVVRDEEPVDVALGFRAGERTEMPAYRRVGKRVLDYATAAASGGPVTDSQCGFRGFGKRAIPVLAESLQESGFAVESEMLRVAAERGLTHENVPVSAKYEGIDGSTQGPVRHAVGVLNQLVNWLTMRRPLLTIGVPGILILLWGAFYLVRMMQEYRWNGNFIMAYALASAGLAILGMIMIATALMLNMFLLMRRHLRETAR